MKKENFISAITPFFSDKAFIFVYFIVKTDSGMAVKKANLNSEDAAGIRQSLQDHFSKKTNELEELDKDFGSLKKAISKSDGILLYDLNDEPQNFSLIREIAQHQQNFEEEYFSKENGRLFLGKDSLKSIDGFVISLVLNGEEMFIYRKNFPINILSKKTSFIHSKDGKFKPLEGELLKMDGKIDYLLFHSKFYIFNVDILEKYDDIKIVMSNIATKNCAEIEKLDIVSNMTDIEDRISKDNAFARKVISVIANGSSVLKISKYDIFKFVKKHKELKLTLKRVGDTFDLSKKKAQDDFIKLLDDDFLSSSLTGNEYRALKKRTI